MTLDLKLVMLNINGVRDKCHEIVDIVTKHSPDIILITESRLNDSIPDSSVAIPGYDITRLDRKNCKHSSGGLLLYVTKNLKHNVLHHSKIAESENITMHVALSRRKFLSLTLLYRPPNSSSKKFLLSLDKYLNAVNPNDFSLIAGDVNLDVFNSPLSAHARNYLQILSSNSFKQVVSEPTRISPQCNSIIDHILISSAIKTFSCKVFDSSCSDHQGILFSMDKFHSSLLQKHNWITFRDHKNFSLAPFQDEVNAMDWSLLLNSDSFEYKWNYFKNHLSSIWNRHNLIKTIRLRNNTKHKPWISNEMLKSMKDRDKL